MPSESDLGAELERVTQRWNQLVDVPRPPRSLLRIIEYSLGSQRRAEVYVTRLLRSLLDPGEPHGMDAEFLDAFLAGLPEGCDFQEDLVDLSGVRVDDQVTVAGLDDEGSEGGDRRRERGPPRRRGGGAVPGCRYLHGDGTQPVGRRE